MKHIYGIGLANTSDICPHSIEQGPSEVCNCETGKCGETVNPVKLGFLVILVNPTKVVNAMKVVKIVNTVKIVNKGENSESKDRD